MIFKVTEEVCAVLTSYQRQQGTPVTASSGSCLGIDSVEEAKLVVMQLAALQSNDPEGFIEEYCDAECLIRDALEKQQFEHQERPKRHET